MSFPPPKYKKGDLVRLFPDSPKMRVASVEGGPVDKTSKEYLMRESLGQPLPDFYPYFYNCQWFSGTKLQEGKFPEESLEAASDGK